MSAGYEPTVVYTWLRQTMIADSVVSGIVSQRVYRGIAELGAPFPNIVMQAQFLHDITWVGPHRVMLDGLFAIRATSEGHSTGELDTLMQRVDTLFNGKSEQVVAGGRINACVRQWNQEVPYVEDGRLYRQLVSLFSIQAQAIA